MFVGVLVVVLFAVVLLDFGGEFGDPHLLPRHRLLSSV